MDPPRETPDLAGNRLERYGQARLTETYERLSDQLEALRTYFEMRLDAADTAIVAARNTTMTALQVAETEREKAAANLRLALEREIESGDARLTDHITHQVEQVKQGLQALTALLAERDGRMDDRFSAHRDAIQKAEDSLNKRLEGMNAFREELREQASSFATREALETTVKQVLVLVERNREDIADQRGSFLPVSTFDTVVAEWSIWRNKVDVRDAEQQNHVISRRTLEDILAPVIENVAAIQKWQFKIAGALILITVVLPGIVAFAVYLLTRTAVPVDGLR